MIDRNETIEQQIKEELSRIEAKSVSEGVKAVETPTTIDTDQVDPFLEEALKAGFDPKFDGPNKKTAEQFVKDGSFFKKINDLKKENEETKKMVRELAEHNAKLEKASYDKAYRELESKRKAAISSGDGKEVEFIEEKQREVAKQASEVKIPKNEPTITPELMDFQERNKDWFNNTNDENLEMAEAADFIDRRIAQQAAQRGITLTQKEHLQMVEDKIKKLYSHRFENVNQSKPAAVSTSTASSSGSSKGMADRLSSQQRNFAEKARKMGGKLTDEAYAKQLNLVGDLRDE